MVNEVQLAGAQSLCAHVDMLPSGQCFEGRNLVMCYSCQAQPIHSKAWQLAHIRYPMSQAELGPEARYSGYCGCWLVCALHGDL